MIGDLYIVILANIIQRDFFVGWLSMSIERLDVIGGSQRP